MSAAWPKRAPELQRRGRRRAPGGVVMGYPAMGLTDSGDIKRFKVEANRLNR